jgi:hypothetical protein
MHFLFVIKDIFMLYLNILRINRRVYMAVGGDNCKNCPELLDKRCDGKAMDCMCRRCPRSLGKCLSTKYCTETESAML